VIPWLAWRLHRRGLLGFSLAGFFLALFYGEAFIQAAGTTAASQAAFGHSVNLVAGEFAFLIPLPVHPETLGGYEQYKLVSFLTEMMAIWAALAGIAAARGDEERGLTEQWLTAGVSRARLLLDRSAAFAIVALVASVMTVLGIAAIAPLVQQDANLAGELGKGLSMAAGLFVIYAIALVVAQLPAERQTGTAFAIGAIVLLLVVNGVADSVSGLSKLGVVTPFHWMNKTTSAAPGGTFDLAATAGLVVAGVVLVGVAIATFARRDVGSGLIGWRRRARPAARAASRNPLLRAPFLEGLWEQRIGLAVWAVSAGVLAALMVAITKSVADSLLKDPTIAALFARIFAGSSTYAGFLGFLWFSFALLLLAGYSVVQVSRWSTQDGEGRVEMLLTAPVSRTRVVIDRAVEFALASLVIVGAGYVGLAIALPGSGLSFDAGRVAVASALLWPFTLAFGGLGVAVASRWPRVAVPGLAAFAIVEYFLGDLAPLFKWPDWVSNLSVFHLYGNPLIDKPSATPTLVMLLVFVAGFAAALFLMRRRDVSTA
jgi:ABC-2 type transport system permease protein